MYKIILKKKESSQKNNHTPIHKLLTKSIRTKLLVFFLPISLAAILIMGFITFENAKNSTQNEILYKLQSIVDLKENKILQIFSEVNSDLRILQNDYVIKPTMPILTAHQNNPSNEEAALSKIILDEQFGSFLETKNKFKGIYLLDKNGRLIYQKTTENPNTVESSTHKNFQLLFENSQTNISMSDISFEHDDYVMFFGAPIYGIDNNFVGIIILELDFKYIFELIQDTTGLGITGETLLGKLYGDEAVFISPIRHDPNAAFNRKIQLSDDIALPIQQAVQGISGSGFSVDYVGEPILAVWKHIPSLNWGLVVKINSAEVMKPIYEMQSIGIIVTSTFAIVIIILTVIASSKISKPILKLRDAMTQIEKGNYHVKIEPSGNDEINDLMKSARKMVETMNQKQVLNDGIMAEISHQKDELDDLIKALNASSIVTITDANGVIAYANDKALEITKYSKDELIGQTHVLLDSGHHPKIFFKGMKQVISKGNVWHGDIKYKSKSGNYYWVRTTIVPFLGKDGKPNQFIRISTDITSQKFTEEKLHRTLKELGKEERLKEEFSTMISHELKTPLTPIKGYCEILKEKDVLGILNREQEEAVDEINRNAARLERLVGDILDAQKLDMGKMSFNKRDFTLYNFMDEVKKDLASFMNSKNIQFNVSNFANISLVSDPDRIRQVIDNLAKNAVDFVPKNNGKIKIGSIRDDNNVIFYIKDNGIGISLEDQKNLFKKFYQVDTSHTRKHGGTGLGLVICKGIIEELGGKIFVKSIKDVGTTFYFTIPQKVEKIQVKTQN